MSISFQLKILDNVSIQHCLSLSSMKRVTITTNSHHIDRCTHIVDIPALFNPLYPICNYSFSGVTTITMHICTVLERLYLLNAHAPKDRNDSYIYD